MSYQDPYQSGQNSGYNQYGGNPNPEQPPQSTDPYSNQPYGSYGQQGGYQGSNPQHGQPGPEQQGGYQGSNPQYGQPGPEQQGYSPNSGYGQPPYGQSGQYGQPQYGQPQYQYGQQGSAYGQPSTTSMKPNTAAGVSYLLGWITGLIFFLKEKQNRFVRFHAMQSIIYSAIATIYSWFISPLLNNAGTIPSVIGDIISIALFVGWIICMVNAFQGKYFKLPYIGDLAEKYANQGTNPPGTF